MSTLFEKTVNLLLSGAFICKITEPEAHNYLNDSQNQYSVDVFVKQIGKTLKSSNNENCFYLAYQEITAENRAQIAKNIEQARNSVKPTVESIRVILDGLRSDMGLYEGQEIVEATIESYAENNDSCKERFRILSQSPSIKKCSKLKDNLHDQIMMVLQYLVREGYLVQPNKNRNIFLVTGKISFLIDYLDFINEREKIIEKVRDESAKQGVLF
ncbi:hypothetical protein F0M16_08195 [Vibrio cholerae]|uniref:Uncharacterized protein n=1 Tax=Vibrio cholerae TaxID=666 RepID=A0A5Q6PJY3_VIBCL|nr:hypothetical protein [Vibrio cholerae]KAA1255188.1 hypothetical protein F0M16_08195 [Vibrio cholerae]